MQDPKYIFVDCFDTIIGRDCCPEQIKLFWANEFSKEIGFRITGEQIYNIRKNVESQLFHSSLKHGNHGEYDVKSVYASIIERLKVGKVIESSKDFDLDNLQMKEVEVELRHQYKITKTIEILKKFKAKGKKIYLLSDFYMGKECFKHFFDKHGIVDLFENVFVSCDYNLNKSSGTIYSRVIEELGVSSSECMMIGDNEISDIQNAKKNGLGTKHIKKRTINVSGLSLKEINRKYLRKEFKTVDKYNLENYAFQLFAAIQELAIRCKKQDVKKLYFLSREGRFLKMLFDKYCEIYQYNIETNYLLVSRNSTFLASLKTLEEEKFERLFKQYKDISILDFLKSLSFDDMEIASLKEAMSFELDIDIKNFPQSKEYEMLIRSQEFQSYYENKRSEQKQIFRKYLKQEGFVFGSEKLNIVDVGWKGSMQDSIVQILDGEVTINGFYLGYDELGTYNQNSFKEGVLFDLVNNGDNWRNALLSYHRDHYECILRANHSRVERYQIVGEEVRPVFEESQDEELYERILKDYQDSVFKKFCRIATHCMDRIDHIDIVKLQPYFRMKMLFKMTKKDYDWLNLNYSTFKDGFGKITMSVEHSETLKHFYADKLRALKRLIINRKNLWR